MSIATKYDPSLTEDKWYKHWLNKGYFQSEPDEREPYCIVIPPPNVTGVLHMGHMLNNTIQDVLIRLARMQGKNALWIPGTDHASIATEAKLVAQLREQGLSKEEIGRDEFMVRAWAWKEKHGGIILEQLKKLGASCDWSRTRFTMDPKLYDSVIEVFIDLYNKGLIYRGMRMVNWDPRARTAVSDEEVFYREVSSKLYYVKYKVDGEESWVTIATTRPETILGDTAVCVNPNDPRYSHLRGKYVLVPMSGRRVPIIEDEYVDMEFGTGCLKITPAHDVNDFLIGEKFGLESINIFNDDGTLSAAAGMFIGEDRFHARELSVTMLEKLGQLVKAEDYINKIGYSERTDAVIEPRLSMQWFLDMQRLAGPALEVVMNDEVRFYPAKFRNTYRHWMENIKDWCISRQLWWGQRIPVYYLPGGRMVVARSAEEALEKAKAELNNSELIMSDLRQDEDVLDTWFSSWLWPISVFNGILEPDNPELKYYYPTNDLVTAPEILFFWVARMIMAGQEYAGDIPFRNVYLTGIVRDKLGRKMSKSLGNSPDPIDLIAQYGADGVRVGMLLTSPAGNDLPFDESLCEQGRNFSNKFWNALRLVKGWKVDESAKQPKSALLAVEWMEARLSATLLTIEDHYAKYRISDALMSIYKLIWDDFCSWYLEMVKPGFNEPIDKQTYEASIDIFSRLMQVLHPFMPFITEEIWHLLKKREEDIIVSRMPESAAFDEDMLTRFESARELIIQVRSVRQERNLSPREALELFCRESEDQHFDPVVMKLANVSAIHYGQTAPSPSFSFMVRAAEYFIPAGTSIDLEAEREKITKELEYIRGFLESVMKKLGNERFVQSARLEVVETERRKKEDAEAKIRVLEEKLAGLK
jgi:valyl-tRNA synthetase